MAKKTERVQQIRQLATTIYDALADTYTDEVETPELYEFAVHPKTKEVKVIRGYSELPEGWFYEAITDVEWDTIWEVASSYFDIRR